MRDKKRVPVSWIQPPELARLSERQADQDASRGGKEAATEVVVVI